MTEPTEHELDDMLRFAARHHDSSMAAIDVEVDLAVVRAELEQGDDPERRRRSTPRRHRVWLCAAAALITVVVIAAVASTGSDTVEIAAPDSAPASSSPGTATTVAVPTPPTTDTAPSTTTTSTVLQDVAPWALATASPNTVGHGESVTITPAAPVGVNCMGIVIVAEVVEYALHEVGQIAYAAYTRGLPSPGRDCVSPASDAAMSVVVPPELAAGTWVLCLSIITEPAGCADVTVTDTITGASACTGEPIPPPSLVDGSPVGEPTISTEPSGAALATWGTGRFGVGQVVGAVPNWTTDWNVNTAITSGAFSVSIGYSTSDDPAGTPTKVHVRGDDSFCPRTYLFAAEFVNDSTTLRTLTDRWIDFWADGTPVPSGRHDGLPAPVEYFGSRYASEAPYVDIHRFSTTGVDLGPLSPDAVAGLQSGRWLDDGRLIDLGPYPASECGNRPLTLIDGDRRIQVDPRLPEAHSVAASPAGVVVATRLVCDGEAVVRWEMVRVDLSEPAREIVVLRQQSVDDGPQIEGAPPGVFGWERVTAVSDDGRLVAVLEPYNTEQVRFHVIDIDQPGSPIALPSSCASATDIVATPIFVANGVVVARWCESNGTVDVAVDHIRLPELELVDGHLVAAPLLPSYGNTIGLSVWAGDPSTFIVTGSTEVERPNTSILNVGDQQVDISRLVWSEFAFDPRQLVPI